MKPTIGRIVVYRSRDGVDMPAIVTGLDRDSSPFLHCFPPPGASPDHTDHQWGVPKDNTHALPGRDLRPGHWRWPTRENT